MGPIVGTGTLKVIRYRYLVLDFKSSSVPVLISKSTELL